MIYQISYSAIKSNDWQLAFFVGIESDLSRLTIVTEASVSGVIAALIACFPVSSVSP